MVNDIEADVRAELVRIGVVLQESVEEHPAADGIEDPGSQKVRRERSAGESNAVATVVEIDVEVVVGLQIQ